MTAITVDHEQLHGFQQEVNSDFDMIWGAFYEDECHRTLLAAYPAERS